MRLLQVFLLLAAIIPAIAQTTPEKLKAITDKSKWAKAGQSIRKAIAKDTLDPEPTYLLSLFYFNSAHPTFQVDSASAYLHRSARLMTGRVRGKKDIPDSVSVVILRARIDSAAFEAAKRSDTEEAYQYFIRAYASAKEVPAAVELRDEVGFLKAMKTNTSKGFKQFMARYPKSHREKEARSRMEKLEFEEVTGDRKLSSYVRFYKEYPNNPFRSIAGKNIFEMTTASGTPRALMNFLSRYPESPWAGRVRAVLFTMRREGESIADGPWLTDSLRREEKISASYWVPVIKSGLYGFMDENGKEVISPRFGQINEEYRCGEIKDRYLLTSKGLMARNGTMVWNSRVKDALDLGLGFILITADSGKVVIHESGFRIGSGAVQDAMVVADRMIGLKTKGKWSIVSLVGTVLLPASFDDVAVLDSVVQLTKNRKRILTTPGRIARVADGGDFKEDFVFDEARKWGEQHYLVRNGVLEGVIDAKLNFLIPLDRQALRKTSFGFVTKKGDQFFVKGIKKLEGTPYKQVTEQAGWLRMEDGAGRHWIYDKGFGWLQSGDSAWFQGQLAFLERGDSVSAFLPAGQRIPFSKESYFEFKEYRDSSAWLVMEEKNRKVVFDAASGARLFIAELDQLEPVSSSLFLFTRLGKKGLVREDGKIILPAEYDAIAISGVESFSLLKDKKFGWLDGRTKLLIKPMYDRNIRPYNKKLCLAFKDNGYGFILPDGRLLGSHTWEDVQYWNDSSAWVKKGGTWKLLGISSQKIKLDNIKLFRPLLESPKERVSLIQQDKTFGVISNSRGTVIPIQYTDIINLGTAEVPLYFTERHIAEAGISVVVYFDQYGKIIRKQAMEADEFEKIACDN